MSSSYAIHYLTAPCSLGHVLLAANAHGICALLLADSTEAAIIELQQRFSSARLQSEAKHLQVDMDRVKTWLGKPRQPLTLDQPLAPQGSDFQQQVWRALRETRPGQRLSYRQLAEQLGKPGSSRAVAGACAANPLAIVVPCHRVLRSDGDISGYRWGVARKRELLRREAAFAEQS